jgi:ERCC4-type nuclease
MTAIVKAVGLSKLQLSRGDLVPSASWIERKINYDVVNSVLTKKVADGRKQISRFGFASRPLSIVNCVL